MAHRTVERGPPRLPRVVVRGSVGLTRDVVEHLLLEDGWDLLEPGTASVGDDVLAVLVSPDASHWLHAAAVGAVVVVVVDEPDSWAVLRLVRLGANAVVSTSAFPAALRDAVQVVAEGGAVLDPTATRLLVEIWRRGLDGRPGV